MNPERLGYAFFVTVGLLVGGWIHRREKQRVGLPTGQAGLAIAAGALTGGVVGSKLMMTLYLPPSDWGALFAELVRLDFDGKTVIGGLTGGYLGVEFAKWVYGIRQSTGDAWAVALPAAHAIGRLGCLANGCCYGSSTEVPWALLREGVLRHPAQVYEMLGNVLLAAFLWHYRLRVRVSGQLFRMYLVGYAALRFLCDPVRGDAHVPLGPLSVVQWYCLLVIVGFSIRIRRDLNTRR